MTVHVGARRSRRHGWVTRPGFSLAIIGADGVGKSTMAAMLTSSFPGPPLTVHMGLYTDGQHRYVLPGVSFLARLLRRRRAWRRAEAHRRAGRLVIFDRYATDALLPPPAGATWWRRWRRRLLATVCPAPDLSVLLDAPGSVLAHRIGGSVDRHEQRRQAYLQLRTRSAHEIVVLDASRDPGEVVDDVRDLVRSRWPQGRS